MVAARASGSCPRRRSDGEASNRVPSQALGASPSFGCNIGMGCSVPGLHAEFQLRTNSMMYFKEPLFPAAAAIPAN